MKLLRFFFYSVLIIAGLGIFGYYFLLNNGPAPFGDKENYHTKALEKFDNVVIRGGFNVELIQGGANELLVEDQSVLDQIDVKVRNGTLYIESDQQFWKMTKYNIALVFLDIDEIHLQGTSHLEGKEEIDASRLNLELSGASEVYLHINSVDFQLNMNGMSSATIWGKAKNTEMKLAGAGKIEAGDLETSTAEIHLAGAGIADINVKDHLEIHVAGAGRVTYKGSPEINQHISGAGSVRRVEK